MKHSLDEGVLTLWLAGRINSVNSPETEREINNLLGDTAAVVLDCEQLEYISSAGLRILLRTAKAVPCIKLVNVHPEVYDILEMTGFTEMMEIHRAYRVISLDGCELIGQGANGRVYRIAVKLLLRRITIPMHWPTFKKNGSLPGPPLCLACPRRFLMMWFASPEAVTGPCLSCLTLQTSRNFCCEARRPWMRS